METRPRTPQVTISSFPDSGTMETLLLWMARGAEVASAAQRKTADDAPSLALTGSRPPSGDYLAPGVPPPTIARVYHGNVNAIH